MKRLSKVICLLIFIYSVSCAPLKPYERIYVDDPEMLMITTSCKNYEHYVQSIREGAISVGGTKGNGGCGCN